MSILSHPLRGHKFTSLTAMLLAILAAAQPMASRSEDAAARPAAPPAPISLAPRADDAPNGAYPGYLSYDEIETHIAGWQRDYPTLVRVQSLGKTYEGRDIPLVRLAAPTSAAADIPEVLFLGGIHPREQQPPIGLLHLGDKLLAGFGNDPALTHLLRDRILWIIPVFNVDGKVYDFRHGNGTTRGADWRKNRHPNGDGTTGVDLNRNFGVQWGGDHSLNREWDTTTDTPAKNIYEGPAPLSEPETQDLARFLASRRGKLRAFLDLHSPLHFLHGPGYLSGPDAQTYANLLTGMTAAQKAPYPINRIEREQDTPVAERSGDTGLTFTWAYYTQGIFGFNMEFAPPPAHKSGIGARYAPPAQIEAEYHDDIEPALLYLIDAAGNLPSTHDAHVQMAAAPGTLDGKLTVGATVHWTPPTITGDWRYAVLVSEGGQIGVVSEFRHAPLAAGFTIRVNKSAYPGDTVPMTLYLWDSTHGVNEAHFTLKIE